MTVRRSIEKNIKEMVKQAADKKISVINKKPEIKIPKKKIEK